jgi:hypothetical protein
VADAAVIDCNDYIAGPRFAAVKVKRGEGRGLALCGVAERFHV